MVKSLAKYLGFGKRSGQTSTLGSPAYWLRNAIGGGVSETGITVNANNSLGVTAVWRAVKIISEGIAGLDKGVFSKDSDGNTIEKNTHYLNKLLTEPYDRYTGFTFFESMQANACLRGNAYAAIIRDESGRPINLVMINPSFVSVMFDTNRNFYYQVTNDKHEVEIVYPDDILHIPSLVLESDHIVGKSPIQVHRESLGLSLATTKYASRFFKNGAHVSGYLSTDGSLKPDAAQRMAESWRRRFGGINNVGKTPVLEEGLKYYPLSLNPQDAMFVETHRLNVEDVSRIFGVPAHMLSSLDRATFSNIEHQSREYVTHTLTPWARRWESELKRKLVPERDKSRMSILFNMDSLLRGDSESRAKLIDTYMKWGVLNRDEIRRMEGFNDIEDGSGKKYYVPLNMTDGAENINENGEGNEIITK